MTRIVLLDSGPLGMISHPKANKSVVDWYTALLKADVDIRIPEIADYEVRRELIRAGLNNSIKRLDLLKEVLGYIPIDTPTMLKAASLWAQMRNQGAPTSDDKSLDGDVILAAQALLLAEAGQEVVVATDNVDHLSLMVSATKWNNI